MNYSRSDPGNGAPRFAVVSFTFDEDLEGWTLAPRANDGRIHTEGSIEWVQDPFGDGGTDADGATKGGADAGGKLKVTCNFDGVPNARDTNQPAGVNNTLDGVPLQVPFAEPVTLTNQTYFEFDLYYPMNSRGKLMRIEIWSSASGGMGDNGPGKNRTQIYIRPDNLEYLNGPVAGEYEGQAYRVKKISGRSPVSTGEWNDLRFDIHAENATAWGNGILFIGNVSILQQLDGDPIPPVVNEKSGADVPSIRTQYADKFLIGTTSRGLDALTLNHFNIFTPANSLKPINVHPNPPQWLVTSTQYPFANSAAGRANTPEYTLAMQGKEFAYIRDKGLLAHGHVLAWFNQSSLWMRQIIPTNITSTAWDPSGLYYAVGNNATPPFFPVNKELARRIYYNHILHELRYFMSGDLRYSDADNDGVIPFYSFDVLNEEVHETRHIHLVSTDQSEWKAALRNTSWLMAMTDDDFENTRQHFVYLLFKFAHIAVPNAQMAAQYKAHYESLDEYMKADKYHDDGSDSGIDAFICKSPPRLFYNDYDLSRFTKAQVVYNMVRELNLLWKSDPLYDGRPLIEGIGIQGHDSVHPTLASDNQRAIALFANLVDEGLLTSIAISELDLVQPDSAPGGGASSTNGDILNQKQADAIAYQYALLFKVYAQYGKYIDRITFWGSHDPGWGGSYKPFDHNGKAAPAYYAIMDPDRFIKGHSYLDAFFAGEYERVK